tara:strand:+ start:1598 stop:2533 length:936 start_codon:yes stop_codon:yes gene_type:complete
MLLEKLITPKPKTTLYFIVFSLIFLTIPIIKNYSFDFFNSSQYGVFFFLASAFFILLHAFGLNNLIYKNDVIKKENLIIATVFVLLNTFNLQASINLFSSFLMLFFLNYLLESYQKEYPFNEIFCSSFILSVIIIINPVLIIMYVLFIICSLVFSYSNWRSYFVSFLGLCMPWIFYFMYISVAGQKFDLNLIYTVSSISFKDLEIINLLKNHQNVFIIFGLITLISILEFFNWLYKKSIRSRKSFFIILAYLILSIVISCFGSTYQWYIVITPLSILIANYFTYTKKRNLANILFYVFIFTSFYYRWNIMI